MWSGLHTVELQAPCSLPACPATQQAHLLLPANSVDCLNLPLASTPVKDPVMPSTSPDCISFTASLAAGLRVM